MKKTANMPGHASYHRRHALCILLLASLGQPTALAETITIGKGTGIVWEGLPFTANLSGPMNHARLNLKHGLLSISSSRSACQETGALKVIAGYPAVGLAPGVGLIPRASGQVGFYTFAGSFVSLSGTLGLPETKGASSNGNQLTSPDAYSWCLPPAMNSQEYYYSATKERAATISGTWVLVADGQQKAAEIAVPEMYAGSFSEISAGDKIASILPSNLKLRISTLECTVNTPTVIAFGGVLKNTQPGAELAVQSYPLITSCGQSSDLIDANINLQFRPLTGLYQSAPSRLALRQGGGYITGEIDNSVTGSGNCATTSGLPFDNRQLKIGRITQAETSRSITNQVTWRLCSGGKDLPLGNVSAAAEMLVTFN
ncbi:hypothetical protein [Serratia fonticola]|uniref:hypothetical protein n=1 Tax=Serratia fonticola TaxID=47917 RepID=UPI00217C0AE0|nr:hypothetical protein [Serratia fonticola]CAI1617332.1 Uncharacterised protein [Serratia fonticola]CAI1736195.1 Uncharacterised protein [Serratia fonticola]CAI1789888.1 Uncharacterised protein [Serratia fonticola]